MSRLSDQTTSINIGTAGTNQVNEQYTFDQQTGLLTNQKAIRGSTTLIDLTYDNNRNNSVGNLGGKTGNLTKIVYNLNNNKNREYEFDAVGRLTKAKGGIGGNLWNQQYTYDRFGNRTNVTATGVAADNSAIPLDGIPNLAFNTASNRINTTGYQYDSAGNMIRGKAEDGSWIKYEYDAANRVRVILKDSDSTGIEAYVYGATNARLIDYDFAAGLNKFFASVGGTTLTEYTEFIGDIPTWTKSYIYFGDSQLSTITPNGTSGEYTEYDHPDRLGTKLKTNQQGGTSYEQAHLPFGKALDAESTLTTNNKRFTSYDRSPKTGLDYAVNRTYDAKQGRFTQVDPIGMGGSSLGSPQTFNLYSYRGNDPINHTDPSGLFWGKLFKWIAKAFKWISIAVTVAVIVLGIIASHGTLSPFLTHVLGVLSKLSHFIGIIARGSDTAALSIGFGIYINLAATVVGAVANSFAKNGDGDDDPVVFDKTFTAILDAYRILERDLKCAKFFGLLDKNGKFSQKKFKEFTKDIKFDSNLRREGIWLRQSVRIFH